ncbi:MAG: hypothetical protein ACLUFV_12000 [Acutalibacteraceae bacterium]
MHLPRSSLPTRGRRRRLRALRRRGRASRQKPVDAEDHRLRRPSGGRFGHGRYIGRQDGRAQLDRPLHGAEIDFATTAGDAARVHATRADTIFGATYMVIAPEHPLVEKWRGRLTNYDEVAAYREQAARKSDFERTEMAKDKTGVRLDGVAAVNPVTGKEIPIFVSDYVLITYGTGAIMAVPAHDERDHDFAKMFGLPVVESSPAATSLAAFTDTETGTLVSSGS